MLPLLYLYCVPSYLRCDCSYREETDTILFSNLVCPIYSLQRTNFCRPSILLNGQALFPLLVTPLTALTFRALRDGTMLRWILNDTYTSSETSALGAGTGVVPSYVNYTQDPDVCLVFLNALAGEGADRTELYHADQDTMVKTVANNCNNMIVVINTMGARLVDQ